MMVFPGQFRDRGLRPLGGDFAASGAVLNIRDQVIDALRGERGGGGYRRGSNGGLCASALRLRADLLRHRLIALRARMDAFGGIDPFGGDDRDALALRDLVELRVFLREFWSVPDRNDVGAL